LAVEEGLEPSCPKGRISNKYLCIPIPPLYNKLHIRS
jgi:hypothetical protein